MLLTSETIRAHMFPAQRLLKSIFHMQVSFIHIRSQRQNTAGTGLNNLETHQFSYCLVSSTNTNTVQICRDCGGFFLQGWSPLLVVMIYFLEYTLNGSRVETTVFYDWAHNNNIIMKLNSSSNHLVLLCLAFWVSPPLMGRVIIKTIMYFGVCIFLKIKRTVYNLQNDYQGLLMICLSW